jgi:energy-coupling factor transporter ATP-binding protein EcfA2
MPSRNEDKLTFTKRVNIFCGHYGSGKSEISVNAAVLIGQTHQDVLMADMDIVNPFFRSIDARNALEALGIKVAAPLFANTNVDVPALVPEVSTALRSKERHVILDVGGDEDGARVLGRYHLDIPQDDYDMFFVFNRARPLTRELNETLNYIREIEAASRQKVTRLINNTHYLSETTVNDVLYGLELAKEISRETGIPLAATCVMEGLEGELASRLDHPVFVLKKNILLPF